MPYIPIVYNAFFLKKRFTGLSADEVLKAWTDGDNGERFNTVILSRRWGYLKVHSALGTCPQKIALKKGLVGKAFLRPGGSLCFLT